MKNKKGTIDYWAELEDKRSAIKKKKQMESRLRMLESTTERIGIIF